MKTGTFLKTSEIEKILKHAPSVSGLGTGNKNGSGGNGGNGGDDGGRFVRFADRECLSKYRVGMLFFLLILSISFGTLAGAYLLIFAKTLPNWKPFDFPVQIWFATVFITASGIVYRSAQNAFAAEKYAKTEKFLRVVILAGAVFIALQISLWLELINRQVKFTDDPFGSFAYIFTITFAAHIVGGMLAIVALISLNRRDDFQRKTLEKRTAMMKTLGWYWQFIIVVWWCLLVLLTVCK